MHSYKPFYNNELRRYPFLLLLIPLCSGIFIQYSFADYISIVLLIVLSLLSGIAAITFHLLHDPALRHVRHISIILLLFFLGACMSYLQDQRNARCWYGNSLEKAETICLKAEGPATSKERTIFIPVTTVAVSTGHKWKQVKGALKLYIYKQDTMPVFNTGDTIIIPANKIIPLRNSGNPFAFDYADYAARNGLFHQAFLSANELSHRPGQAVTPTWLTRLRNSMLRTIRNNITDSTTAALVEATLLNERSLLDEDIWRAYSRTGIVHIIAISGMHVTLLFNILLFFLLWVKNKKLEWIKYFTAIPLVWLYVGLTGFPPSAVRAATMFTLLAFGIRLNRETNSINILMATAFLLLCYNPYWLYDTGFQLSFIAVLSILTFYGPIRKCYHARNKLISILWDTFAVSLAAQVLTFPLAIFYFHQFPLWVLVANIPAAAFSLLLMVGSLLLLAVSIFTSCTWLGDLLTLLTKAFHAIILGLSRCTPVIFQQLFIDTATFWLILLVVGLLAVFLLRGKRNYLTASLVAFSALTIDLALQYYTAGKQKRIIVYNASRLSLIDFFNGRTVQYSGSPFNALDKKTVNYILLPARLGYHATKSIASTKKHWTVYGKSILFLQERLPTRRLKVNYLIISNRCHFNIPLWKNLFDPETIIIDGSIPRWKAVQWSHAIVQAGIRVHWVQEQGAWIFPQ